MNGEALVKPEEEQASTKQENQNNFLALTPVMDIRLAKARLAEFQEFVRGYLVDGEDYGMIPGIPKPTLLKPGADKLCEVYGLADTYEILNRVEVFHLAGKLVRVIPYDKYIRETKIASAPGAQ